VLASESGVLPIPENKIVKKWRLQPGKMFLIDFEQGRIIEDEELKAQYASAKPYRQWIENVRIKLDSIEATGKPVNSASRCWTASRPSAFTQEDIKFLMAPMATNGEEATAPWATIRPWPCCRTRTSRCTTTSSSCSPR
jgi:glutamate synthase (NADPH/NADH) large chain